MQTLPLDRSKWHQPLVSVIVPFFNYAAHIEDCLLSIIDQTHGNWECVVVDDGSESGQLSELRAIVDRLSCGKIAIISQANKGQIPSFFAGLDVTQGEFVCAIDPDDRYAEDYFAEMLAAHLNPVVMCPIASSDQYLLKAGQVIAGVNTQQRIREVLGVGICRRIACAEDYLYFWPAEQLGWHWGSISSMMMRRSALAYLKPIKTLDYPRSIDSYIGPGCHLQGGTLFLAKPLLYRQLHGGNSWLAESLHSTFQLKMRGTKTTRSRRCFIDAQEALLQNGAPFVPSPFSPTITGEIPS